MDKQRGQAGPMSVAVPKRLLDGLEELDNRSHRLIVASAVGGKPVMREVFNAMGNKLSRPGKVSAISALMEFQAFGLLKVVGLDGDGIQVEIL